MSESDIYDEVIKEYEEQELKRILDEKYYNNCITCFSREHNNKNVAFTIDKLRKYLIEGLSFRDIVKDYKDYTQWYISLGSFNNIGKGVLCPHYSIEDIQYYQDKLIDAILNNYFDVVHG